MSNLIHIDEKITHTQEAFESKMQEAQAWRFLRKKVKHITIISDVPSEQERKRIATCLTNLKTASQELIYVLTDMNSTLHTMRQLDIEIDDNNDKIDALNQRGQANNAKILLLADRHTELHNKYRQTIETTNHNIQLEITQRKKDIKEIHTQRNAARTALIKFRPKTSNPPLNAFKKNFKCTHSIDPIKRLLSPQEIIQFESLLTTYTDLATTLSKLEKQDAIPFSNQQYNRLETCIPEDELKVLYDVSVAYEQLSKEDENIVTQLKKLDARQQKIVKQFKLLDARKQKLEKTCYDLTDKYYAMSCDLAYIKCIDGVWYFNSTCTVEMDQKK